MTTKPQSAPAAPKEAASAGLRAFFKIAERWQLSNDEALILLGQPGRSTFFEWKKGHTPSQIG